MEQQSSLTSGEAPLSRRALREAAEREAKQKSLLRRSPAPAQPSTSLPNHSFSHSPFARGDAFVRQPEHAPAFAAAEPAAAVSRPAPLPSRAVSARTAAARAAAARPAKAVTHRWIPRAAVLTSLAVATIAVPLSASAGAGSGSGASNNIEAEGKTYDLLAADTLTPAGPSAASVLSSVVGEEAPPPSTLAQVVSADERTAVAASRSADERTSLSSTGCDTSVLPTGTNGLLSDEGMCELWGTGKYIRSDAADALTALNEAFTNKYGTPMCVGGGYRSLQEQYATKAQRGGFAATPGTSNHGLGLAVDLCSQTYQPAGQMAWLRENAPLFGWDNPEWARAGGSGAFEPWHWEYTEAVSEKS